MLQSDIRLSYNIVHELIVLSIVYIEQKKRKNFFLTDHRNKVYACTKLIQAQYPFISAGIDHRQTSTSTFDKPCT